MMAVDTSALMAILLNEPGADACVAALEDDGDLLISAGTVAEALILAADPRSIRPAHTGRNRRDPRQSPDLVRILR